MNTRLLAQMTLKQKEKELDRLFRVHREGLRQSVRSLESGHGKIAIGCLEVVEETRAQIATMMLDKKRSLSVEFEVKELLAEQEKNEKGLTAAVQLKSVKDARTFSRWALETDSKLIALA